jgi:muramoyltetrapeptide carboxypeptidase
MRNIDRIAPPRLRRGDCVGVFSPSWGGAGAHPHRVERGVAALEQMGYRVKLGRHALGQRGYLSGTAAERASDLHELFLDPEVRVIVSAIGGDHSCQLLPLLDFELMRRHPTLVMGYSDMTVLNVAIWQQTGLVTCNGPALLTDFAEFPAMLEYTRTSFERTATLAQPIGELEPSAVWTEEILSWQTKLDLTRPRALSPSPGWTWLKGEQNEGVLIGGCLESLQHLRGTRYWPEWSDAILFFETSEEHPPPETVDGMLMDYENMGVLEKLRGMIVGRPMRYSDAEKAALREILLERTQSYGFPIVCDVDFGHTWPQLTLPLGCRARIDVPGRRLTVLDAAVS